MKKYFILLFSFALISIISNAQLNSVGTLINYYDISNWTQVPGTGTIDISGAPNTITFTSGNSGITDFTYIEISAPSNGVVSFKWTYSTIDIGDEWLPGAYYDFPFYIKNGNAYRFSSYNPFGADTQSGVESFTVLQGQTFGFGAYTEDGFLGSCTIDTFSFSLPVVPIAMSSILAIFGLACLGILYKRKRTLKRV